MAALANQSVKRAGLKPAYATAAEAGDTFLPGENVFLHVKNDSEAAKTVTIVTPKKVVGAEIADIAVAVPAEEDRLIGPFPAQHFAAADDGRADVTYSAVTELTVAALVLTQP
jgi:hypothetical protein